MWRCKWMFRLSWDGDYDSLLDLLLTIITIPYERMCFMSIYPRWLNLLVWYDSSELCVGIKIQMIRFTVNTQDGTDICIVVVLSIKQTSIDHKPLNQFRNSRRALLQTLCIIKQWIKLKCITIIIILIKCVRMIY